MKIHELKKKVGKGRADGVIRELINIIGLYKKAKKDGVEVQKPENGLLALSARISALNEQECFGTVSDADATREKRKVDSSLLKLLDEIENYEDLFHFIEAGLGDEIARAEVKRAAQQEALEYVESYMENQLSLYFQPFQYSNLNELDGLLCVRQKDNSLGEKLFFKIKYDEKTANGDNQLKGFLRATFDNGYLEEYLPLWKKSDDPVVLLYVTRENGELACWWGNLKSEGILAPDNSNQLIIPKQQKLGPHSQGDLKKLFGYKQIDKNLPVVLLSREDVNFFPLSTNLKAKAREFYRQWAASPREERMNPGLGEVIVNRVGWRHIGRGARKPERMIQSWLLLGAARKMIQEVGTFIPLGRNEYIPLQGDRVLYRDLIALKSRVIFPQRFEGEIMVVLRRKQVYDSKYGNDLQEKKVWLYSIFESRRGVVN